MTKGPEPHEHDWIERQNVQANGKVEALIAANPGVHPRDIRKALDGLHEPGTEIYTGTAKAASAGALSAKELAEAFAKLGTVVSGNSQAPAPRFTSDDALTLILEEIRHAPDPMKAAGQWITRFTNGVTDITRNLDDD